MIDLADSSDLTIYQNPCTIFLQYVAPRLITYVPCFPAFFDLFLSIGQQGLVILLLKNGPNLGLRSVILYPPVKLLEFLAFNQSGGLNNPKQLPLVYAILKNWAHFKE